jgi:hypothetical protein
MDMLEYMDEEFKIQTIGRLLVNLHNAELRCLTKQELLEHLSNDNLDDNGEIDALLQLDLTTKEKDLIVAVIRRMAIEGDKLPSPHKRKIDRRLCSLLKSLKDNNAVDIAASFLDHERTSRSQVGYAVLRKIGVGNVALAKRFISEFEDTKDENLLHSIIQTPDIISQLDYKYLLSQLTEDYWRMRVFEALIPRKYEAAVLLAPQYPVEFTWAAGRLIHTESLPNIKKLLDYDEINLELLSIYTWALGQFKAKDELDKLRKILKKIVPDCQLT